MYIYINHGNIVAISKKYVETKRLDMLTLGLYNYSISYNKTKIIMKNGTELNIDKKLAKQLSKLEWGGH